MLYQRNEQDMKVYTGPGHVGVGHEGTGPGHVGVGHEGTGPGHVGVGHEGTGPGACWGGT